MLVLHFAAIVITFCVSITFCGDYYILRRNNELNQFSRYFERQCLSSSVLFKPWFLEAGTLQVIMMVIGLSGVQFGMIFTRGISKSNERAAIKF